VALGRWLFVSRARDFVTRLRVRCRFSSGVVGRLVAAAIYPPSVPPEGGKAGQGGAQTLLVDRFGWWVRNCGML